MSKAIAIELRVEEAKKQIRRASYDPSARSRMVIDRRAIDEELRENGFDGIHSATPEQIKEAKLRLTLRADTLGEDATIWTAENMRKLNTKYHRPLHEPLDFDLFLESLRRFGKVTKKMMQEDEAMMRRLMGMMEEDEAMMKKNRIGYAISYKTTNEGMNWMKGEVLEKTPDQLEKIESMMRRPMI